MSTTETTSRQTDRDEARRAANGAELPPVGTYQLDPAHSHVGFSVRHMAIAKVRGVFTEFDTQISIADQPEDSSVSADISLASIDTGNADRDAHLQSADFFDVEHHPTMRFNSTSVRSVGSGAYVVDGTLSIGSISNPVSLELSYEGVLTDPWGNDRFGFSARAEINRDDFGLTWNQALETGGVVVGKKVSIEIEGSAVRIAD